jgi:hypothetical protein
MCAATPECFEEDVAAGKLIDRDTGRHSYFEAFTLICYNFVVYNV